MLAGVLAGVLVIMRTLGQLSGLSALKRSAQSNTFVRGNPEAYSLMFPGLGGELTAHTRAGSR